MAVQREAFWGYTNGERRRMSEMPPRQYGVIFQELKSGEAAMQYELPLDGRQDAVVWKPSKEREQQARDEVRLEQIRQELSAHIQL